jgi:hypothetical protein
MKFQTTKEKGWFDSTYLFVGSKRYSSISERNLRRVSRKKKKGGRDVSKP